MPIHAEIHRPRSSSTETERVLIFSTCTMARHSNGWVTEDG